MRHVKAVDVAGLYPGRIIGFIINLNRAGLPCRQPRSVYKGFLNGLCYLMRYCDEIDSLECTRRIVSAKRRATEMMVHLLHCFL